jgi:hypothetical protein
MEVYRYYEEGNQILEVAIVLLAHFIQNKMHQEREISLATHASNAQIGAHAPKGKNNFSVATLLKFKRSDPSSSTSPPTLFLHGK